MLSRLAIAVTLLAAPCAAAEKHWSYQPIQRPALPRAVSARNAIDRFILDRLQREKIAPSKPADRSTLIRRVTLDLIGLPPSPSEVAAFLSDGKPGAYERLVERLLASPRYGERWARPWLDLCHYADSDGYLTDQLRPVAWRYRQWLVQALNANMPFDQFTIEQLAGDLLPNATIQQRVATGFLRQTLSNREGGADLEEFRTRQVLNRTNLAATTWLALTVGCAQCHDHKYDRISQREFYQLYAFFNNADEININAPLPEENKPFRQAYPGYVKQRDALQKPIEEPLKKLQLRWEAKLLHAYRHPGEDAHWDRQWEVLGLIWGGGLGEGQLEGTEIVKLPWSKRTWQQKADLLDYFLRVDGNIDRRESSRLKLSDFQSKINSLKRKLPKATRAPTMRASQTHRPTHLFVRGEFRERGDLVHPDTLATLPRYRSGKKPRLAYARWLVNKKNPLTARVTVNRMWQAFFGRGLVLTSDDFGIRGTPPSHPRLLDWLAAEFMECDWDVKQMHRLIVNSSTYRQSSVANSGLLARDPYNILLARQSSLRVSAEVIRDIALFTSGLFDGRIGGPNVKPPQSPRVTDEAFGNHQWKASSGGNRYRRGLYTFTIRTAPFAQSAIFDAPNPTNICTKRERSNTSVQALTLLNDPVFFEAAEHLGKRLVTTDTTAEGRIELAFRICLSRSPSKQERSISRGYIRNYRSALVKRRIRSTTLEARLWTGFASVMLNLHETITRD